MPLASARLLFDIFESDKIRILQRAPARNVALIWERSIIFCIFALQRRESFPEFVAFVGTHCSRRLRLFPTCNSWHRASQGTISVRTWWARRTYARSQQWSAFNLLAREFTGVHLPRKQTPDEDMLNHFKLNPITPSAHSLLRGNSWSFSSDIYLLHLFNIVNSKHRV